MASFSRSLFAVVLSFVLVVGCLPPALACAEPAAPDVPAAPVAPAAPAAPADQEILVVVAAPSAEGVQARSVQDVAGDFADAGMVVTDRIEAADAASKVLCVSPAQGHTTAAALDAARAIPGVVFAQPNYRYHLVDPVEDASADLADPADPANPAAYAALNTPPLVNDPAAQISDARATKNQYYLYASHLVEGWQNVPAATAGTIAVLDTGVRLSHEDLSANLMHEYAYDAFYKRPLVATPQFSGDISGHGTHVAGIAAGVANNGRGIAGAAYGARILPVKVFDSTPAEMCTTKDLLTAYEYLFGLINSGAVSDLHVINLSLGSYGFGGDDVLFQKKIADARTNYRILTVCAGGNGDRAGNPYTQASYPCDFRECMAVTALDTRGNNAYWSDYNHFKDISASGVRLFSTYGAADASYTKKSGTSMSSPLVAGAAALCFAAAPGATVDEVCNALYATARPVVDPVNDRRETSGSHGAIDAAAALQMLAGSTTYKVLAGSTALDTMAAIAADAFTPGACKTVIVTTKDSFQDALCAAGLAGALKKASPYQDVPVLITEKAQLSTQTAETIAQLGAQKALIVGGEAVVSEEVKTALEGKGLATSRVWGATAIETALRANELAGAVGNISETAIVATSAHFADALAVAPYAYAKGAPIYLTDANGALDAPTLAALKNFAHIRIVGGAAVVSDATQRALIAQGATVKRWSGTDCYQTSARIAEGAVGEGVLSFSTLCVATGKNYYDALSASSAAGSRLAPLLLVDEGDAASYGITAVIAANKAAIAAVQFLGGPAVVTPQTQAAVRAAIAA
ncbi:MAG: S8 family serine peptidase [Raoultibacter sp.]